MERGLLKEVAFWRGFTQYQEIAQCEGFYGISEYIVEKAIMLTNNALSILPELLARKFA